jgi:hypothetical protein
MNAAAQVQLRLISQIRMLSALEPEIRAHRRVYGTSDKSA